MKTTRNSIFFKGLAKAFQLLLFGIFLSSAASCDDSDSPTPDLSPATATYRADVALSWLNMQLKLARTTSVTPANTFGRPYGYCGIVGYEAVAPGMAGYKSLAGQLNGLTGLPTADRSQMYSWPLSANAALAAINRSLFANTSVANLASIDSLESVNRTTYGAGLSTEVQTRSVEFGQRVAAAVAEWARTDGYNTTSAYTLPTGPGMWVPTAPGFGNAAFPFWGANRPLVAGSNDNADPGPPMTYSEANGSPFREMARDVYTTSQTLSAEQRAIASFWNDLPNGRNFTPPGHWISILAQVLARENKTLDQALLAYAKVGISLTDAQISCFKTKYTYNLLRPITYIRGPLGQGTWNSLIPTPAFPEYSSAHAVISGAAAEAMTEVFGPTYAFTDQNYVPFGLPARSFTSFEQAATEAGISRFYGGIHYLPSCEKGQVQGKKVAQNIRTKLAFR